MELRLVYATLVDALPPQQEWHAYASIYGWVLARDIAWCVHTRCRKFNTVYRVPTSEPQNPEL